MWRLTKTIIIVLILLLGAHFILTLWVNSSTGRLSIASYIQPMADKKIVLDGDLKISWRGGSPTIYVNNVKLFNQQSAFSPHFATVEQIKIRFFLLKLLTGKIQTKTLELIKPKIWLESPPKVGANSSYLSRENIITGLLGISKLSIYQGVVTYSSGNQSWQIDIDRAIVNTSIFESVAATELEIQAKVNNTPLEINGKINDLNNMFNDREVSLDVSGSVINRHNTFHIYGVAQNLLHWQGVNLWFAGKLSQLGDFSAWVGVDFPDYTNIHYKGELLQSGESASTLIRNVDISSEDYRLIIQAQGELAVSRQRLSLDVKQASVFIDGIELQAKGRIGSLLGDWETGLPLKILSIGGKPSAIVSATGLDLSAFLGRMVLIKENKKFHLDEVVLTKNDETVLQGMVKNLGEDITARFKFDYKTRSLPPYHGEGEKFIELFDSFRFKGEASYTDGEVFVDDIAIYASGEGLQLTAKKNNETSVAPDDLELDVQVAVKNLIQFQSVSNYPLPSSLPFQIGAKLKKNKKHLSLSNIKTKINSADFSLGVTGRIADLSNLTSDLNFDLKLNNVETIATLLSKKTNNTQPTEIAKSTLTGFSNSPIISANGHIRKLTPFQFGEVNISFSTLNVASLWPTPQAVIVGDLAANGDVKFVTEGNQYRLNISGIIGDSDFSGDINVIEYTDLKQKNKFKLIGDLDSKNFDLSQLLPRSVDNQHLFSEAPFDLSLISHFNSDIQFNIQQLRSAVFNLQNTKGNITVNNNDIMMRIAGQAGEETLVLSLNGKRQAGGLSAYIEAKGEGLDVSVLSKLQSDQNNPSGKVDIDVNLTGVGLSNSQIMSNAYGWIKLGVRDARIEKGNAKLFSGNLLLSILNILNLWKDNDKYADLDCAVLNVAINKGVIDSNQAFAIQTDRETILGGSMVDFSDESLHTVVSVKKRTGLNTNFISNLVRISGSLAEPKIVPDARGVLQSGAALGVALASGGISFLLKGLYDMERANSDVCNIVMKQPSIPAEGGRLDDTQGE